MSKMLTVGFEYLNESYCSIILVKESGDETEYKITIMEGRLQSFLTPDNVIKQKNGYLYFDTNDNAQLLSLKLCIAKALGRMLNMPIRERKIIEH